MEVQEMKGLEIKEPPRWNILEAQKKLQQKLFDAGKTDHAEHIPARSLGELLHSVRFNKEALGVEMVELLDHLPWKGWKTYPHDLDAPVPEEIRVEVAFELIDALHFIVNLAIALGLSWEECEAIYYTKHLENLDRITRGY